MTWSVTPSANMQRIMCFAKNQIGVDRTNTRLKILFDPGPTAYTQGSGFVVCAQTPAKAITGMMTPFLSGHMLRTKTEYRIELASGSAETEGYESPPTGGSWSWCTLSGSTP